MSTRIVPPQKAAFLRFQLEIDDDRRKKVALQEIARIHRSGGRFQPETRRGLELTINGLLSTRQEEKVTRWCLNCIAQLGTRDGSINSVERVLQQQDWEPEIVAAATAAAAKLYAGQLEECEALRSVQPEIRTLAAMQVTPHSKLDLEGFHVEIDTADDEVLKLALIAVGLNRAYENMFHPKHSNSRLVKALGQHDNIIVKQYTVWCVIENSHLTIDDLGIRFDSIEIQPSNVQAKMLELGAEHTVDPKERHGLIELGTHLPSIVAREGLAKGLRSSFYDGLEGITLDWFDVEQSLRVKELLAEHFARYGNECRSYADKALEILEIEPALKRRLFVGAEGTAFHAQLKAQDLGAGTFELFDDIDPITEKLMNKKIPDRKVLMLCASPKDVERLRLDEEARDLKEQLRLVENAKVNVRVSHAWAVRNDQIQTELFNHKPEILHFSGHGGSGVLCFEDKYGSAITVSATAIEGLVKLNTSVDCLVLNACYSETIAEKISPHVRAVVGCSSSIGDKAAIIFSKAFYRAIAHGVNYRKAFEFALNELQISKMDAEAKIYQFVAGKK